MKTQCILPISIVALFLIISGCGAKYEAGVKLTSPNELKIKKGFEAFIVTTAENGQLLVVEQEVPGTIEKRKPDHAWACDCAKENDEVECKIKTSEGSDTAECRGDCFCGFKKVPLPKVQVIKTKTPLKKIGRQ